MSKMINVLTWTNVLKVFLLVVRVSYARTVLVDTLVFVKPGSTWKTTSVLTLGIVRMF